MSSICEGSACGIQCINSPEIGEGSTSNGLGKNPSAALTDIYSVPVQIPSAPIREVR